MLKDILIFIDTETGGLDPSKHSLLTISLMVVKDGIAIDTANFFIKHKIYNVTPKALEINGIDLVAHDKMAHEHLDVINEINVFLGKHCTKENKGILVGQNVNFDKNFLEEFLKSFECDFGIKEYRRLISHRTIDLMSITAFLNLAGVLDTTGLSLNSVIEFLDITPEDRHTAHGDNIMTLQAFNKMLELMKRC